MSSICPICGDIVKFGECNGCGFVPPNEKDIAEIYNSRPQSEPYFEEVNFALYSDEPTANETTEKTTETIIDNSGEVFHNASKKRPSVKSQTATKPFQKEKPVIFAVFIVIMIIVFVPAIIGYTANSKTAKANANAKVAYTAATSVLTDFAAYDIKPSTYIVISKETLHNYDLGVGSNDYQWADLLGESYYGISFVEVDTAMYSPICAYWAEDMDSKIVGCYPQSEDGNPFDGYTLSELTSLR